MPRATIGEIKVEEDAGFYKAGGLLGLCFPEFAEKGVELVFDTMMNLNVMEANLFSFVYYPDEE